MHNGNASVRVNFISGVMDPDDLRDWRVVDPDFTVDLRDWHGVGQDPSQIVEFIQDLINDLRSGEAKGFTYCLCGDTLVLVTDEYDNDLPYAVTLCKVTHRGFARKSR